MTSVKFYEVTAAQLVPGVSTDDGQDVLAVRRDGQYVSATVYTPRPDDPEVDAENRATPETRIYRSDELVRLAEFPDTPVVIRAETYNG